MRLETAMAKASLSRVDRRDPHKLVHKMKIAELAQLAPAFDWAGYYSEMQYPDFPILNVDAPDFIKEINTLLTSEPIENWRTYLRFHVADVSSPYLSAEIRRRKFRVLPQSICAERKNSNRAGSAACNTSTTISAKL